MSFQRHEMGLRPVLGKHVSSVTSSWASNMSYHAICSARALVFSQECRSCHFVCVVSLAIVAICVAFVELVTYFQSAHHVVVAAALLQRTLATACRSHLPVVSKRAARGSTDDCRLRRPNSVMSCAFRGVVSAVTRRASLQLWFGELYSTCQDFLESFRVCRAVIHPTGSPRSALLCAVVRSPSTLCSPVSLRTQTHPLRDVGASAVLFDPGFRRCRSSIGMVLAGSATPRVSEYVQQHVAFPAILLVRWCAVIQSPPTRVHAACRTNHFTIELSRLIVAPICRSVKSLIARICPWMV